MSLLRENDTIAAIATPAGPGGIGIVRISGDMAPEMFHGLFRPSSRIMDRHPQSHRLYHGWFIDPETGEAVDEVLAVLMRAPASYTREHVLEIQCHSGPAILSRILEACLYSGARLADPGEFTRRAFLNGRIDLVQAEAVAEITSAKSHSAGRLALSQLQGRLSERVDEIRHALKDCLASLEVAIDYPDEDVDILDEYGTAQRLSNHVIKPIEAMISEFERTRIFRQGAGVLIAGRPNVGKSSLLNALLCEDRAIVSAIPGTTRDPVEAELHINGIAVKFTDTAGIRPDPDPVEAIGIGKVREMFAASDLVLWLLEAGVPVSDHDLEAASLIARSDRFHQTLIVFSKCDMQAGSCGPDDEITQRNLRVIREKFPEADVSSYVCISSVTGQGLPELEKAVADRIMQAAGSELPDTAINTRHRAVLSKVLDTARRALQSVTSEMSPEISAMELREALTDLSEVTGEGVTEEVLNHLFSSFCLGK